MAPDKTGGGGGGGGGGGVPKVPIYCWVDRESFPVIAWHSQASTHNFVVTFCTIIEPL